MVQHATRLLVFGGYGGADAHKRLGNLVAIDTSTGAACLLDPSGNLGQPSCKNPQHAFVTVQSHT